SRRRHTMSKRDWSSDVCSSDLLGYPLRQSLKNVGVKGIRRLTPDGVREANINNAAGHRLYVTLVPVSHRRFLRASVRVNHPRVEIGRASCRGGVYIGQRADAGE